MTEPKTDLLEDQGLLLKIFNLNENYFSKELKLIKGIIYTDLQKVEFISKYLEEIKDYYYGEIPERFIDQLSKGIWFGETDDQGNQVTIFDMDRWIEDSHREVIIVTKEVFKKYWSTKELSSSISIFIMDDEDEVHIDLPQFHRYDDHSEWMDADILLDFYGIDEEMQTGMRFSMYGM